MALEVYFKSDIANVIRGNVLSTVLASVANGAGNVEFVRGSLALAQAQCLSFGIDWPGVLADLRNQAKIGGWVDLLEAAQMQVIER